MKPIVIDKRTQLFECPECHMRWQPILKEGGRLPRGSRKCPRGCLMESKK